VTLLRLITLFTLLPQSGSDELQKRVRVDGQKIYVDDKLLYDGPWLKSEVVVRDFAGWKHVIVNADGEERVRLPVRSIAKPIAWPPVTVDEVRPLIKKLTEERDGKVTFTVVVTTEKGEFPVYIGAPGETKIERAADAFIVKLGDKVIYRVSRAGRAMPRPEAVLDAMNAYRTKSGLGKVRLSATLSKACDLHALYLSKNDARGLSGHEEDPRAPGYTEEGAKAGKRSVISPFAPHETAIEAVDSLMATLYHRVSMLQPELSEVGIGWAYRRDGLGHLVIDVSTIDLKTDPKLYPTVYPVNGQKDVPIDFGLGARETPNPIPGEVNGAGYPITVQLVERKKPYDVEAKLFLDAKEVDCWFSSPSSPARDDWPQPGVVGLIPMQKLKPDTTYIVKFKEKTGGTEREWAFTTRK
jgi:hypothetical protein